MPDPHDKAPPQDRGSVDLSESAKLHYWAAWFAVSIETLWDAVAAAGTHAVDVSRYLRSGKSDRA